MDDDGEKEQEQQPDRSLAPPGQRRWPVVDIKLIGENRYWQGLRLDEDNARGDDVHPDDGSFEDQLRPIPSGRPKFW